MLVLVNHYLQYDCYQVPTSSVSINISECRWNDCHGRVTLLFRRTSARDCAPWRLISLWLKFKTVSVYDIKIELRKRKRVSLDWLLMHSLDVLYLCHWVFDFEDPKQLMTAWENKKEFETKDRFEITRSFRNPSATSMAIQ